MPLTSSNRKLGLCFLLLGGVFIMTATTIRLVIAVTFVHDNGVSAQWSIREMVTFSSAHKASPQGGELMISVIAACCRPCRQRATSPFGV
jgi:hypothetical protein